jgi:hypothetical protein
MYVDAAPERAAGERPGWDVAVRNQLRALERTLKTDDGSSERWLVLSNRLANLDEDLARLLDPRQPGRGRAMFVPLSNGEPRSITLQLPLRDRVVLQQRPYIRPLVGALAAGGAAGVGVVSRSGVRVHEWRCGVIEEMAWFGFRRDTSDWREMKGPAAANPALTQHTAPQRDRFARRLEERRAAFLRSTGKRLAQLAAARDWQLVLLTGDPRLVGPLHASLAVDARELVCAPWKLESLSQAQLAATVADELSAARLRGQVSLADRLRDEALAGGSVSLGLDETLRALEEGRVSHLLIDAQREYHGGRGSDDRVVAHAPLAGDARGELDGEPDLGEQMVERALQTRAMITPLEPPAAERLANCDGVAGLLRW